MIVTSGDNIGVLFEGSEGTIWPGGSDPEGLHDVVLGPDEIHLYDSGTGHHRNFIDCVISRGRTAAPVEQAGLFARLWDMFVMWLLSLLGR